MFPNNKHSFLVDEVYGSDHKNIVFLRTSKCAYTFSIPFRNREMKKLRESGLKKYYWETRLFTITS